MNDQRFTIFANADSGDVDPLIVPASTDHRNPVKCDNCGKGEFYWSDGDGWFPHGRVIDANADGAETLYCPGCDRDVEAEDPHPQLDVNGACNHCGSMTRCPCDEI